VEALPIIIERLRAMGYGFVPVSQLAGLSRDQAMPPISAGDRRAAEVDLFLFGTLGRDRHHARLAVRVRDLDRHPARAPAVGAGADQARRELRTVFRRSVPTASSR